MSNATIVFVLMAISIALDIIMVRVAGIDRNLKRISDELEKKEDVERIADNLAKRLNDANRDI